MNTKIILYQIPYPSTSFQMVSFIEPDGVISYKYFNDDDILCKETISFQHIRAVQVRTEKSCRLWHIEHVYDILCEVVDSSWLKEVNHDTDKFWRDEWQMHHYIIYLEDIGCLEVIAESWKHHIEEIKE